MKFYLIVFFNFMCVTLAYADFCSERAELVHHVANKSDFEHNLKKLKKNTKLYVLGEPHGTYYLHKVPEIIEMLSSKIDCAFVEHPVSVSPVEFQRVAAGEFTEHFRIAAGLEYGTMFQFFIDKKMKIFPVDALYSLPEKGKIVEWMVHRDDSMMKGISNNLSSCNKAVFIVGKHHITPDLAKYTSTLGQRLKRKYGESVKFVDMLHMKNYREDYCSYKDNKLFDKRKLFTTEELSSLPYSLRVNHSFWSDFDFILFLPEKE